MRYRLMATYQGVPYEAGIGPSDGDVVLFAACPPPEELGFEPATGHWRKQLRMQDVQALWESKPTGRYRGERCLVLDDLGDRLHIAYLGHDAYQAQQLGYWQVDRGVFELVTARDEVTEITEERFEYPEPAGPSGLAGGPPAAPDYDPATADLGPVMADHGPATADFGPPAGFGQADDLGPATADYGPVTADFSVRPRASLAAAPTAHDAAAASSPGLLRPDPPPRPGFTVLPPASEPPLPLEAEALRAASAAALPRQARPALDASPLAASPLAASPLAASPPAAPPPAAPPPDAPPLAAPPSAAPPAAAAPTVTPAEPASPAPRRRRSARSRMATQRIFIELATLAAIPAAAYAVGEEVDGALCLIESDTGYEVFSAAGGARHEVRVFEDEESAYFYLFGVLAAEAVRTGQLISHR
jgi:hypothetical protein